MTVFLGIDPGGRETGIVVRRRDELLAAQVVVRQDDRLMPNGDYCAAVAACALRLLDSGAGMGPRDPDLVVCVEDVRYWPQQKATQRNLTGLLGAAIVLGAVYARWADAVTVPPGSGHGGLHESAYPAQIRPRRSGKGTDKMRHCRSAWDCTHHGETLWRQRKALTDAT